MMLVACDYHELIARFVALPRAQAHYFVFFSSDLSSKMLRGPKSFGRNLPTCRWYSLYSVYFFAEISSVNQVDDWKSTKYDTVPIAVQLVYTLEATQDQRYMTTQTACSAAKLG